MFVTWRDLTSASLNFRLTYPHVLVRIKRPKLRLGIGRHNHQFPFIEDPGVANYFDWLTAPLDDAELDANIWPTGASGFLPRWKSAARVLHVSSLNLVLAGLRAGGVTHHFLNVGLLRRGARTTCTRRHLLFRASPCLEKQSSASLSAASASIPCAACGHARPWVVWSASLGECRLRSLMVSVNEFTPSETECTETRVRSASATSPKRIPSLRCSSRWKGENSLSFTSYLSFSSFLSFSFLSFLLCFCFSRISLLFSEFPVRLRSVSLEPGAAVSM